MSVFFIVRFPLIHSISDEQPIARHDENHTVSIRPLLAWSGKRNAELVFFLWVYVEVVLHSI